MTATTLTRGIDGRRAGQPPVPLPVRAVARRPDAESARPRPRALHELGVLVLVYVGYSLTRVLVDPDPGTALANGELVLAVERWLWLDVEAAAVQWLVGSTALSVAAGYLYAALHYTVTPAVLVWLYRVHPDRYRSARRVLVGATCVALVWYWLVPTAPPRLLHDAYPDVLALTADYGWWGSEASAPRGLGTLTNQYAALPSMHVGWAIWCGLAVAAAARSRAVRAAALFYPALITAVVVVTANHYVLDAAAGAALVWALMAAPTRLRCAPRAGSH
jgi:hypothetical protein